MPWRSYHRCLSIFPTRDRSKLYLINRKKWYSKPANSLQAIGNLELNGVSTCLLTNRRRDAHGSGARTRALPFRAFKLSVQLEEYKWMSLAGWLPTRDISSGRREQPRATEEEAAEEKEERRRKAKQGGTKQADKGNSEIGADETDALVPRMKRNLDQSRR